MTCEQSFLLLTDAGQVILERNLLATPFITPGLDLAQCGAPILGGPACQLGTGLGDAPGISAGELVQVAEHVWTAAEVLAGAVLDVGDLASQVLEVLADLVRDLLDAGPLVHLELERLGRTPLLCEGSRRRCRH